jgi:hypothetical protein
MKLRATAIAAASMAAALCLAGCTLPTPISGATGITGNWELIATSTQTPFAGGANPIGIYLTASAGVVTGIPWVQEAFPAISCSPITAACENPFEGVGGPMAGTIDAAGDLTLSSLAVYPNEPILTITGKIANNNTLAGATYTVTGIPFPDQGTVTGSMIAPVNGTYVGTVVSNYTGLSLGVSMTVAELPGPDSGGFLHLSGSANFTGSPCFSALTEAGPPATYSGMLGSSLTVNFVGATSPNVSVVALGTLSPDAKTIQFQYGVVGGGCATDFGKGPLTLQ